MPIDDHRAANRANWDDRVAIHWQPDGYDAPAFIADPHRVSGVVQRDRTYVGDVEGKRLLHLQCHFGMDTLSWARLGAEVTGIDFSDKAIAAARRLVAESGTPGRFVEAELYDSPAVLDGERFDVVYTGVGALNWLPDIEGWARVVAGFLEPGGVFFVRDGHPVLWTLEWDDEDLVIRYPYFETPDPISWQDDTTYLGSGRVAHPRTFEWNHGVAETIGALLDAGLAVDGIWEHRELEWQGLERMELHDDGLWRLPSGQADLVPLMLSIRAHRP